MAGPIKRRTRPGRPKSTPKRQLPEGQDPAQEESQALRSWQGNVTASDKIYDRWESDFACDLLEEYYLGHQWNEQVPGTHYTINMCYPTVETRIPSLIFFHPKVHVTPVPSRADDVGSHLDARARLLEDTAQSFMARKDTGFMDAMTLSLRESFYRFGVVEVGYSASVSDNPQANRPILREDGSEMRDSDDQPVVHGDRMIEAERLFVRRIPASNFRVSPRSTNVTNQNDWVGYYEYLYPEDIKAEKSWDNTSDLKPTGTIANKAANPTDAAPEDQDAAKAGLIKVWKVWDLRAKVRHIFPDIGDKFFKRSEPWPETVTGKPFLNLAFLRQHPIMDSWYPLPPMFNWISPQDELNETRDMQKVHRKRANRHYLVQEGTIREPELRKLESGGDMAYAMTPRLDCMKPVDDAPLDRAIMVNVPTTREDFGIVSGTPPERRGSPETQTATQAAIIDTNAKIRDSYARQQVGQFISEVVWIMLETIRARFTLPTIIQVNVDPASPSKLQEALQTALLWKEITSTDLGDLEFEVSVDVESLSPVTDDLQRQQWTQVLAMITNPMVALVLSSSPAMLKKTLNMYGVRSSQDIAEVQQALQVVIQAQLMAAAAKGGGKGAEGGGGGAAGGPGANMGGTGTPSPEAVVAQLIAQVGGGAGGGQPS